MLFARKPYIVLLPMIQTSISLKNKTKQNKQKIKQSKSNNTKNKTKQKERKKKSKTKTKTKNKQKNKQEKQQKLSSIRVKGILGAYNIAKKAADVCSFTKFLLGKPIFV